MPDRLSLHEPVLVNTIGHCAGAIIFGILLYLLILDWRRTSGERSALPSIAAALALLWNIGSLIGIASPPRGAAVADAIVAASFSILGFLPAVLLHISLRATTSRLWMAGYAVSTAAAVLHLSDLITSAPRFHHAGILVITIGFAALTAICLLDAATPGSRDRGGVRLGGAMALFLLAVSFAHFESAHAASAWSGEAALHHAAIPLALFVLLQEYRFLLLDVFIRLIANALLAAAALGGALYAARAIAAAGWAASPFFAALLLVTSCLLLALFGRIQIRLQRWLTRAVFLRSSADQQMAKLRELGSGSPHDDAYLAAASRSIAEFLSASQFELLASESPAGSCEFTATTVENLTPRDSHALPPWTHAVAPLHFSRGDSRLLLLGARAGKRRYLSEDMEVLNRLAATISEQVERIRAAEMQNLVAQAELKALEGQINPHFLFNSLNALYGTIDRDNAVARGVVANLATLFRYALSNEGSFVRVEQEMKIVRAFLEIEQLRLGSKLRTWIEVDEDALLAEVPMFSIQPLVENAVRHGVAPRRENGFVRVAIRSGERGISVQIGNSGAFRAPAANQGIGLANVRRRLSLCYGGASELKIDSEGDSTTVRFDIPLGRPAVAATATAGRR